MPTILLADPSSFYDKLSAWSTLGATVVAAVAIGLTIALATLDRRRSSALLLAEQTRAAQERTEADQRLQDERNAADQRLRDERDDMDRRQQREWQQQAAAGLLRRISDLHPHTSHLSNYQAMSQSTSNRADRQRAIDGLVAGAHTEALMLRDPVGTKLYRNLVALVVSIDLAIAKVSAQNQGATAFTEASEIAEAASLNVRRYARMVRLWLQELIDNGAIPPEVDNETTPVISAHPPRDWAPSLLPPGWWEDTATDPADPQFSPTD
ncbi:hypothetical protein [Kitasatospora sp. NPDC097643]|uniref:hypothetical protein n=1 Tax=Kitasatospora sp. NPDC097643 TaxID=3157230 RepID=UPI003317E422